MSLFIINTYFYGKKSHIMHFKSLIHSIKERREMLQVTQETLADLSGVGLRTLKQFESGQGNPTAKTLNKIGSALGMELAFKIINTETSE
ncbi:helix-turn-helix domain-containing protein [uncultured Maribacter sp.]|uniref:helix-turn-helix domain-containing protein n=1 Tax=uncultured Maribacter sp. TaxID=431308 RepID=UPI0030EEFF89